MVKLYGIEYDNGEPWEDGNYYALDVLFKSKEEAIDYIKNIEAIRESEDYGVKIASNEKVLRFNKEEKTYNGEIYYYLEEDPDEAAYYGSEGCGFFKVLEFELQD